VLSIHRREIIMQLDLPSAVAAYFDAANDGDSKRVALCFAEDAVVRDEEHDMRGRAAIQAWTEASHKKYAPVTTPLEANGSGHQVTVVAQVAGTFPGSPLPLHFRFAVGDSGISELVITA
jgi:ketosteroid isomerase-like protein